jgi:DNA (cytosine-5)-methyltransferase 1
MRHLDLFSGIGGFALAAQWANMDTVAFCEIDQFCQKVLAKNFPNVPIHNDIKTLNGEDFAGIDIITGGYPCQPFSSAGKRRGSDDPRHLWPEMLRVIRAARPNWVVCEHVVGHISNGIDTVLNDFKKEGYETRQFVIPALAVGAPHRRDRVWIVANTASVRGKRELFESGRPKIANAGSWGFKNGESLQANAGSAKSGWSNGWNSKPRIRRVGDGLPSGVDRNKGLGNAIVPQIAYEILRAISAT